MTGIELLLFIIVVGLFALISLQQKYTNDTIEKIYEELKQYGNIR